LAAEGKWMQCHPAQPSHQINREFASPFRIGTIIQV